MAYESYALLLSALSSLFLLAGLYYTYLLSRRTGKTSVVWALILFAFSTLLVYQLAEVAEYGDELVFEGGALHAAFETFFKVNPGEAAGSLADTVSPVSAAILVCTVLVIRRSLLVPI